MIVIKLNHNEYYNQYQKFTTVDVDSKETQKFKFFILSIGTVMT